MYLTKSLIEGLRILGFDKETIKNISREKNLEEIFLSTLFLNYIIVLVVYILGLFAGGYSLQNREINMPVFFGLLIIYPFAYNLVVYGVYGFFGLMAELLDNKKNVKPLISVGFHTALVYTILVYVIALLSTINLVYGAFLLSAFALYFVYTMFLAISIVYNFSLNHTLIVLLFPLFVFALLLIVSTLIYPETLRNILSIFFV